jgi:hypothetical protein
MIGEQAPRQPVDRELEEGLEVHRVGAIVPDEPRERIRVAPPERLPEPDGIEAVNPLDPGPVADSDRLLDPLEPAGVSQAIQDEPQVDVDPGDHEAGKPGLEERDVEQPAVECA